MLHSFATRLLKKGTNLHNIHSLLGHSSSKTTKTYTHLSTKEMEKIKSPLDDLDMLLQYPTFVIVDFWLRIATFRLTFTLLVYGIFTQVLVGVAQTQLLCGSLKKRQSNN